MLVEYCQKPSSPGLTGRPSIPERERLKSGRSCNLRIKIILVRIVLLDQRNLPGACPFLEALLLMDGFFNSVEAFEINQPGNIVLLGKAFGELQFVLGNAADQIVSHADIERATNAAGENVNVEAAWLHLSRSG